MGTADGDKTPAWELEVTAPDKKNEKPFSYICELHATGNSLQTESTKLDGFFNRRLTQTFLSRDHSSLWRATPWHARGTKNTSIAARLFYLTANTISLRHQIPL